MTQTKYDTKQKSSIEITQKMDILRTNPNNLDIYSLFNEYYILWYRLAKQEPDSLPAFYNNHHATLKFISICKFLGKKQVLLEILNHREKIALDFHLPAHVDYRFYQNWLWFALTESNHILEAQYLSNFKSSQQSHTGVITGWCLVII